MIYYRGATVFAVRHGAFVTGLSQDPMTLLLLANLIFFVAGMFLDSTTATLLIHGRTLRGGSYDLTAENLGEIKAGNYELHEGMTNYDLFLMITDGLTSQRSICRQ